MLIRRLWMFNGLVDRLMGRLVRRLVRRLNLVRLFNFKNFMFWLFFLLLRQFLVF